MPESHDQARVLFNDTAEDYQKRSEGRVFNFSSLVFQRRIAIVEGLLRSVPAGSRVLDYGMGPGVFAPYCVSRGCQYLGVDISPEMIERARALGLHSAEYMVGDLDSVGPFRCQMDVVMAIGLIDYLQDPATGISALAGCVKPGGWLLLSFRNHTSLPRLLRDSTKAVWRIVFGVRTAAHRTAFLSAVHERSFDFGMHLKPLLAPLGFGGFQVRYFNCSPVFFNFPLAKRVWKLWYTVDSVLARPLTRYLCSGFVLLARRDGP